MYLMSPIRGVINTNLSDRGKTFVKENYKDIKTDVSKTNAGEIFKSDCFNLSTPYFTNFEKFDDLDDITERCTFHAKVINPYAQLTVSIAPINEKFIEDSGIIMRRTQPKNYNETKIEFDDYDSELKFSDNDEVTYFVEDNNRIIIVSFTALSNVDNIRDEEVKKLLDSIEYHEKK